jgi:hypothetical protein
MELGSTQFTNAIAYVSLIVSSLLAVFYIRDRRNARYAIETDYCNQLLAWHALVVEVLIELCGRVESENETKHSLLLRLSSLIEQGRFYFPNISPEKFGLEKPPAYRGYRNVALDFLVASYNLHKKPSTNKTETQALDLQRLFTSVVFEIIRPSERLITIRKLTDRYFVKDLSMEDLEDSEHLNALAPIWDRQAGDSQSTSRAQ